MHINGVVSCFQEHCLHMEQASCWKRLAVLRLPQPFVARTGGTNSSSIVLGNMPRSTLLTFFSKDSTAAVESHSSGRIVNVGRVYVLTPHIGQLQLQPQPPPQLQPYPRPQPQPQKLVWAPVQPFPNGVCCCLSVELMSVATPVEVFSSSPFSSKSLFGHSSHWPVAASDSRGSPVRGGKPAQGVCLLH